MERALEYEKENGQGNTSAQNIASKATQGGANSDIITAEIKVGNFPPEYASKNEKKNITAVVSKMASFRNTADEKAYSMYAKFGALAQKSGTVMIPVHEKKHWSELQRDSYTGHSNVIRISTLVLGGKSDDVKALGMQTWLHENAHAMDAMAGWLNGVRDDLSANDHDLTAAVSTAYGNFLKSQNPWGVESQKIVDEYKAEQKAHLDRVCSWTTQYNDWLRKNQSKGNLNFHSHAIEVRKYLMERQKKEDEKFYGRDGREAYGDFFDMYDALTGGYVYDDLRLAGHGRGYYINAKKRNKELFANWAALKVANPELAKIFKREYPNIANALDQLVDKIEKLV